MNVKKELEQIQILECKIQMKIDVIRELRSKAESCTSCFKEQVQTSPKGDTLSTTVAKIWEFERELNKLIDQQTDLKIEIVNNIDKMTTPEYVELLHRKYIKGETLVNIAHYMNYSYSHVKRVHRWALQEYARICKTNQINMNHNDTLECANIVLWL